MTADSRDDIPYEAAAAHESERARRHYWAVAIGLQDVDGLEVSPYLRESAEGYIQGSRTLDETGQLIRTYHENGAHEDTAEADLVSLRIAELLSGAPFYLAPEILPQIHKYLFQDLEAPVYHPGEFKQERMVRQEEVLNGDSVLYADPLAFDMALKGAMDAEQAKSYGSMEAEELAGFCHSIAFLWQVHPFYEGNTRTIAVFAELYLRHLGFEVANEPFERHARYFRDALVRAMYRNAAAGIMPDESFLASFFENALVRADNELRREDLVCTRLFDEPGLIRNVDPASAFDKRKLRLE